MQYIQNNMAIKKTLQIGDPVLRKRSKKVSFPLSRETKTIIKSLIETMRKTGLIGMAAPQISKNVRIFVTEIRETGTRAGKDKDPLRVFINPRIIGRSKKQIIGYEGCGSVLNGGIFGKVKRYAEISITAQNEKGERRALRAKNLLSIVIQHENDHLDGILFTDKLSDPRTLMNREEYIKEHKTKKIAERKPDRG